MGQPAVKVVLPYTHIEPGVREALAATGWEWEEVDVSGSDENYWSLLHRLWQKGESIYNVEHDVLVRPDSLNELAACPEPWCGFAVPYLGGEYPGMCCVKFSAGIIAVCPDALDQVATMSSDKHPPKHWCSMDHFLQMVVLPATGYRKHVHWPALGHYRDYAGLPQPSHGCCHA
jgi:hypothetical protein